MAKGPTEGALGTWSPRLGRWPAPREAELQLPGAESAGVVLDLHGGRWNGAQAGGSPGSRGSGCQGPTAGGHELVCGFVLLWVGVTPAVSVEDAPPRGSEVVLRGGDSCAAAAWPGLLSVLSSARVVCARCLPPGRVLCACVMYACVCRPGMCCVCAVCRVRCVVSGPCCVECRVCVVCSCQVCARVCRPF